MSASYEKPTNELRGVIRDGVAQDVMFRIQRKWLVFHGVPTDPKRHCMGSMDGTMINGVVGRPVWRDLSTVTEADVAAELSTNA